MFEFPTERTLSGLQGLGLHAAFVAAAVVIITAIVRSARK